MEILKFLWLGIELLLTAFKAVVMCHILVEVLRKLINYLNKKT